MVNPEPRSYGSVWISKSIMYARQMEDGFDDEFDVICNIA